MRAPVRFDRVRCPMCAGYLDRHPWFGIPQTHTRRCRRASEADRKCFRDTGAWPVAGGRMRRG